MIHPIKPFNYNKAITFKNSTPAQAQVSTKTSTPAVSSQPAKPPLPTTPVPTLPVNKKMTKFHKRLETAYLLEFFYVQEHIL